MPETLTQKGLRFDRRLVTNLKVHLLVVRRSLVQDLFLTLVRKQAYQASQDRYLGYGTMAAWLEGHLSSWNSPIELKGTLPWFAKIAQATDDAEFRGEVGRQIVDIERE